MKNKIYELIEAGWSLYSGKVSGHLLNPENEKMMQLQLSLILQTLAALYESTENESIKVLLEVPVSVRAHKKNIIDIVIQHVVGSETKYYPIELKCFRKKTRDGKAARGGGNLSMYDYWEDIENIELYSKLEGYKNGIHLTITDHPYFVNNDHSGEQVKVYSTSKNRAVVTGLLKKEIKNREGSILLCGRYSMSKWKPVGDFFTILQIANSGMYYKAVEQRSDLPPFTSTLVSRVVRK